MYVALLKETKDTVGLEASLKAESVPLVEIDHSQDKQATYTRPKSD